MRSDQAAGRAAWGGGSGLWAESQLCQAAVCLWASDIPSLGCSWIFMKTAPLSSYGRVLQHDPRISWCPSSEEEMAWTVCPGGCGPGWGRQRQGHHGPRLAPTTHCPSELRSSGHARTGPPNRGHSGQGWGPSSRCWEADPTPSQCLLRASSTLGSDRESRTSRHSAT